MSGPSSAAVSAGGASPKPTAASSAPPSAVLVPDEVSLREAWASLGTELVDSLLRLRINLVEADRDGKHWLRMVKVSEEIETAAIKRLIPDMVRLAIECGDTDGTGEHIQYLVVVSKLADLLIEEHQSEDRASAEKILTLKSSELKTACDLKATDDTITCASLKEILTAEPFSLMPAGLQAVLRALGLKDDTDKVTTLKVLFKYAKGMHEELLAGIRKKIIDKYTTLQMAFRNIAKGTSAIKVADLKHVLEDLDKNLSKADLARVLDIADADRSGTIEFSEFNI
ncbi:hypothetical protein T484DRAFT_1776510, partial [Baffinella frigidus]